MEQIEAQNGKRADMSEALNKKLRVNPLIGGRRPAGNPYRPGDDVKRRLPFDLEVVREFKSRNAGLRSSGTYLDQENVQTVARTGPARQR